MSTMNEQDADRRVNPALRLHPGQQALTPEQEVEARRFAQACIQTQLSTEPVDEQEAERLLRQVYEAMKLTPPARIVWVDGPLQFAEMAAEARSMGLWPSMGRAMDWISDRVLESVERIVVDQVRASVQDNVGANVWESVASSVWASTWDSLTDSERATMLAEKRDSAWGESGPWEQVNVDNSVQAYTNSAFFARARF